MPKHVSGRTPLERVAENLLELEPIRGSFAARCVDLVVRLAKSLDQTELANALAASSSTEAFLMALSSPNAVDIVADPLAAARIRGLRQREELLTQEGGTIGPAEVAKILGLSRQGVDKRRHSGKLLAIEAGRRGFRYPVFQFVDGGVLPGLEEVLEVLATHPPLAQLEFFVSGDHRIGGDRPLDRVRRGDLESVKRAASEFRSHGAA